MKIYLVWHTALLPADYNVAQQVTWNPYLPSLKDLPIKKIKGKKGHAFRSGSFRDKYLLEHFFWPEGFFALEDMLLSGGNTAECGLIDGQLALFRVNPIAPEYQTEFPTYEEIASSVPAELNYFIKYANTDFRLVTENFVQQVERLQLKNLHFVLRWDGQRSYPQLPS